MYAVDLQGKDRMSCRWFGAAELEIQVRTRSGSIKKIALRIIARSRTWSDDGRRSGNLGTWNPPTPEMGMWQQRVPNSK